jgi:Endonuclease/Exonuclease/phosphatase family
MYSCSAVGTKAAERRPQQARITGGCRLSDPACCGMRPPSQLSSPPKPHTCHCAQTIAKGGSLASTGPDEVSVLSWNCLADCMHQAGDWEQRFARIVAALAAAAPDVICLQECDTDRLDNILARPELADYEAVAQDTKGRAGDCLCVTFALRRRLRLWWRHVRSRVLVTAYMVEDSGGSVQALYVANAHLSGHPR